MRSRAGRISPLSPLPPFPPPKRGAKGESRTKRVGWGSPAYPVRISGSPFLLASEGGKGGRGERGPALAFLLAFSLCATTHAQTPTEPAPKPTPRPPAVKTPAPVTDAAVNALINAIRDNDAAKVKMLLVKGVNVNASDANGSTPLMQACAAADVAIVSALLEKGAEVSARDKDGFSPLVIAAYSGKSSTAELLLQKGAPVDSADAKGRTALMGAAYSGRVPVVKLLLDRGAVVGAKDAEDFTALMVAAGAGNVENVRLLIDKGADVNKPTKTGFTPLMQACGTKHPEVVKLLLDHDALVNNTAMRGANALLVAAYAGDPESVRLLLRKGARVDAEDAIGHTPLIGAAYSGNLDTTRTLADYGAKLEAKTKTGFTALMQAAYSGRVDVVRFLMERGADVEVRTAQGITPLMQAAGTGNEEIMRLLLEGGADVNAADQKGQTAAAWAAKRDHKEVIPLLKRAGGVLPDTPAVPVPFVPLARLANLATLAASDPKPTINAASVLGGTPGRPFLYRIPATGKAPLMFSASGLPSGLTLDAKTGTLTGKMATAGEYPVTLAVSGPAGKVTRTVKFVCGTGKLALTPPMGWSAWNLYGETVTAEKVRLQTDWLIKSGLAMHGYQYVLLDDTWQGRRDTQTGELDSNRRMGDIKSLADYVHSKGLKLGIYSSPNEETCAGYAGSMDHEDQDAKTFAGWGVDYLKYDWCDQKSGRRASTPELLKGVFSKMRTALDKTDRDIVYAVTTYGLGTPWEWAADKEVRANSWWTTAQIIETWEGVSRSGFGTASKTENAGPGHWNDPGWLLLGKVGSTSINPHFTKLTPDEQKTQFTVWCMSAAPLILSNDLTQLDPNAFYPVTTALLTNDEVIAIDQDALGKPGAPIDGSYAGEIWGRPLADGTIAVALFNKQGYKRQMAVTWEALKLSGPKSVRDLWLRKDLGEVSDHFSVEVPAHGVVLLKLGKPKI